MATRWARQSANRSGTATQTTLLLLRREYRLRQKEVMKGAKRPAAIDPDIAGATYCAVQSSPPLRKPDGQPPRRYRQARAILSDLSYQISTSAPSSMTRSGGIRKNWVDRVASRVRTM